MLVSQLVSNYSASGMNIDINEIKEMKFQKEGDDGHEEVA
jgi:hypothetical protein